MTLSFEDWLQGRAIGLESWIGHVYWVPHKLLVVGEVERELPRWLIVGWLESGLGRILIDGLANELPGLLQRSSLRLRAI